MVELDNCSIPKNAALIGAPWESGPHGAIGHRLASAVRVAQSILRQACPFRLLPIQMPSILHFASDAGARHVIRSPGLATIGSDEKNLVAVRAFFQQDCRTIVAASNPPLTIFNFSRSLSVLSCEIGVHVAPASPVISTAERVCRMPCLSSPKEMSTIVSVPAFEDVQVSPPSLVHRISRSCRRRKRSFRQ
jgi:hypothetical protein